MVNYFYFKIIGARATLISNQWAENKWGQISGVRSTLISNQKGQRLRGADDLWYSTMRKPPLASAPFD
jgi:hypothetical protein